MPILDKQNKVMVAKYNEFVRGKEYSSLTQDYGYLCSDKNSQFEIVYLEQNDNIIATMAVVVLPIKNKHTMLLSYKGPVCDIYDIKLVNRLMEELKPVAEKYNSLYFVMNPEVVKEEKLVALYKKNKYKVGHARKTLDNKTFHVDLKEKNIEEVYESFQDKTKYNIEAVEKKELKFKVGTTKRDFEAFMQLYKTENMLKFQDIQNFEMFKELLKAFDNDVIRIFTVSDGREKLASAIMCKYGNKVKCLEEAYLSTPLGSMARTKIHYEAIKWAVSNSCDTYDMGYINNEVESDYRFKEGFATKEGSVQYVGNIYKIFSLKGLYYSKYKLFGGGLSEL